MQTGNLIGQVFGRWTVLGVAKESTTQIHKLDCVCSCGTAKVVAKTSLTQGTSKSCGCLKLSLISECNKTHGKITTTEYRVWSNMLTRCRNPNHRQWHRYGGRGIKVCPEWLFFEGFLADMGLRPEGTTLDRGDNDGDYCKANCRWVTKLEQSSNTSQNLNLTYEGVTKSMSEWAREKGVNYSTLRYRISQGISAEVALSTPLQRGVSLPKIVF